MAAGARLAEPGEFTLRAFLNGRIDLVQAEAVADLIDAVTPLQARAAFDQLEGTLTERIGEIDRELFDLIARIEASLDFPDEGYHFVAAGEAATALRDIEGRVCALLCDSKRGRLIREGAQVAIAGKPNVGKSSLFNALLGAGRAIVAPLPGTTRDLVTETADIDGLRVELIDTAGIREGADEVETEGVTRARRTWTTADLVMVVLDGSQPLETADVELLRETSTLPPPRRREQERFAGGLVELSDWHAARACVVEDRRRPRRPAPAASIDARRLADKFCARHGGGDERATRGAARTRARCAASRVRVRGAARAVRCRRSSC